jgi:hypothetical protein
MGASAMLSGKFDTFEVVSRQSRKDELKMSWHIIWQRSTSKKCLKVALKPTADINHGRKRHSNPGK